MNDYGSRPFVFNNINNEDGVSFPLWKIGLVPGQNLYGRQTVASCHPHSTALTKSKGAGIQVLFGASAVVG